MKNTIFVSDAFANQYQGGAELTTEAIIAGSPSPVTRINSAALTTKIVEQNKEAHFVICNFAGLEPQAKLAICKNVEYSIIEYDYKFCAYRSPEKHKIRTGQECDCVTKDGSKINLVFYGRAKKIWFMSEAQRNIFLDNVTTIKKEKTSVLSSVFSAGDLRFMNSIKNNPKNKKYLILDSGSWIKGTRENVKFAEDSGLQYELVKGLQYHELLIKLSTSKGLIFRPLGGDTCPRIVIEAKLLGCDLKLNDNVQHKNESWFETIKTCEDYLDNRINTFWSYYE